MLQLFLFLSLNSGPSGEEIQLCSKAIKTSDIDNPGHFEKHYESSSSSTHSDSSSDNEQDFVSSILSGNRPNLASRSSTDLGVGGDGVKVNILWNR